MCDNQRFHHLCERAILVFSLAGKRTEPLLLMNAVIIGHLRFALSTAGCNLRKAVSGSRILLLTSKGPTGATAKKSVKF